MDYNFNQNFSNIGNSQMNTNLHYSNNLNLINNNQSNYNNTIKSNSVRFDNDIFPSNIQNNNNNYIYINNSFNQNKITSKVDNFQNIKVKKINTLNKTFNDNIFYTNNTNEFGNGNISIPNNFPAIKIKTSNNIQASNNNFQNYNNSNINKINNHSLLNQNNNKIQYQNGFSNNNNLTSNNPSKIYFKQSSNIPNTHNTNINTNKNLNNKNNNSNLIHNTHQKISRVIKECQKCHKRIDQKEFNNHLSNHQREENQKRNQLQKKSKVRVKIRYDNISRPELNNSFRNRNNRINNNHNNVDNDEPINIKNATYFGGLFFHMGKKYEFDELNKQNPLNFPEIIIKDVNKLEDANKRCMICLEYFISNEKVSALPCIHLFHIKCIKKWTERKKECPVCKLVLTQHNIDKKIKNL